MIISNLFPGISFIILKYLLGLLFTEIGISNVLNLTTALLFPIVIYLYTKNQKYTLISIIISIISIFIRNMDFIFVVLLGPICEEIVFRGMCLKSDNKLLIVLSSLLFGISHTGIINIVLAFCLGVVLCIIKNTRGLNSCVIIHCIINLIIFFYHFIFAI